MASDIGVRRVDYGRNDSFTASTQDLPYASQTGFLYNRWTLPPRP